MNLGSGGEGDRVISYILYATHSAITHCFNCKIWFLYLKVRMQDETPLDVVSLRWTRFHRKLADRRPPRRVVEVWTFPRLQAPVECPPRLDNVTVKCLRRSQMSLTDRHRAVLIVQKCTSFIGLVCVLIRCLQRALRMRIVDDVKRIRITLKLRNDITAMSI